MTKFLFSVKVERFVELVKVNLAPESDLTLSFEHCVNVQKGVGKPSQTDLMLFVNGTCIAVEAKYTEPRYDTVKKWKEDSENKRLVPPLG